MAFMKRRPRVELSVAERTARVKRRRMVVAALSMTAIAIAIAIAISFVRSGADWSGVVAADLQIGILDSGGERLEPGSMRLTQRDVTRAAVVSTAGDRVVVSSEVSWYSEQEAQAFIRRLRGVRPGAFSNP